MTNAKMQRPRPPKPSVPWYRIKKTRQHMLKAFQSQLKQVKVDAEEISYKGRREINVNHADGYLSQMNLNQANGLEYNYYMLSQLRIAIINLRYGCAVAIYGFHSAEANKAFHIVQSELERQSEREHWLIPEEKAETDGVWPDDHVGGGIVG